MKQQRKGKMKVRRFAGGWGVYRDTNGWHLLDPSGYDRYVGETWLDSVATINLILENHGVDYRVS